MLAMTKNPLGLSLGMPRPYARNVNFIGLTSFFLKNVT